MDNSMFMCLNCLSVFEEPKIVYGELLEHFGIPCRRQELVSPCCEDYYVEAYHCEECGEYITTENYIKTDSGKRICDECFSYYRLGDEN
jgi:hypothetical protein